MGSCQSTALISTRARITDQIETLLLSFIIRLDTHVNLKSWGSMPAVDEVGDHIQECIPLRGMNDTGGRSRCYL